MTAYVQSAAHTNGTIVPPPVSLHPTVKSDVGGCARDGRQPDEAIKTASQGHVNLLIFQLPGLTRESGSAEKRDIRQDFRSFIICQNARVMQIKRD